MATIIKLFSNNPKDGTTTFNKIRFYRATDNAGTGATLITTVDVDLTTVDKVSSGFTTYVYTNGSLTEYYASAFYNSTSLLQSTYSTWVLGGQDRWDTMFKDEMKDTASAVWSATDRGYFKKKALEAIYPDFFYESIDTSLTLVNNSTTQTYSYTLPMGIFQISEVGLGDPNDKTNYPFVEVSPNNWKTEQNKLVFTSLSGLTDAYPIRLVCSRKFLDVGEVPERLDPMVMIHLRMSAYQQMVDDYPRFLQWSRLQGGTKVTFEGLKLLHRELGNQFNLEKERQKNLAMSSGI